MDVNQFFLMTGGLLVISLLLLGGGIYLYRSRQEAADKKASTPGKVRPLMHDEGGGLKEASAAGTTGPGTAPAADHPMEKGRPLPEPRAASPVGDPATESDPMLKTRTAAAPEVERKPVPVRQTGGDAPPPEGMIEILRVYRNPFDAQLSMQFQGRDPHGAQGMSAGQLAQLKRVIHELAEWVEQVPAADPVDTVHHGMEGSSPSKEATSESEREGTGPEKPLVSFADTLPQQPEIKDMLPFRRKKIQLEPSEPPEPPKSIAMQIDEIIQNMLPGSPLSGQSIRLSEVPGGGLLIVHNGARYQGIDEVEDPDAKALIKKAVHTWNERNKI